MKKLNNKKGFTLAELLIVVAIIAVLVAISIPIFSSQLEKAREATDLANVRAAYAEVVAEYLDKGEAASATIDLKSNTDDCLTNNSEVVAGVPVTTILTASDNKCTVSVDKAGVVKINGTVAKTGYLGS